MYRRIVAMVNTLATYGEVRSFAVKCWCAAKVGNATLTKVQEREQVTLIGKVKVFSELVSLNLQAGSCTWLSKKIKKGKLLNLSFHRVATYTDCTVSPHPQN